MFKLTIKTDNAAFVDDGHGNEIGRILRELADILEGVTDDDEGALRDVNGNTVGRWTLEVNE